MLHPRYQLIYFNSKIENLLFTTLKCYLTYYYKVWFQKRPPRLLLDFENGSKYFGLRGIKIDVININSWQEVRDPELINVIKGNKYETIIIDPFCGSGTTLVAAKTLGIKYVGIDIDPDCIAAAKRRIQLKTSPLDLDVGPVRELLECVVEAPLAEVAERTHHIAPDLDEHFT